MAITGQEPATLDRGPDERRRRRRSRSTSPCAPWPMPRGSRSATTTSRPSTSASPLQVNQKPNQVRKAYERNDAVRRPRGADPQGARRSTGCCATSRSSTRGPAHRPSSCCCRPRGARRADEVDHRRPRPRPRGHDHDARPRHDPAATTTITPPPTKRRTPDRARLQLPRPQRRRADEPGRAGLRPLLAAAQGATSSSSARRSTTRSPTSICAQMLHLESENPDKDINIYINCPGGDITALFAIYDTMQFIKQRHRHDLLRSGGVGGGRAAGRRHQGQAPRPAARPHPAPPALRRRRRRPGHRHRARGQGDPAHARPARGDAGRAHRPDARADPQGHRPRLRYGSGRGRASTASSTR